VTVGGGFPPADGGRASHELGGRTDFGDGHVERKLSHVSEVCKRIICV
jgi:hypothetical protein